MHDGHSLGVAGGGLRARRNRAIATWNWEGSGAVAIRVDNAVLAACSIASGIRGLVTWAVVDADRWVSGKIVVAVAWLADVIAAANDDVGG